MAEPLDPTLEEIIDQAVQDHARHRVWDEDRVSEHPSVDALARFQEGLLSDEDAAVVRAHVDACSDCAEDLERMEAWDAAAAVDESLLPSAEEVAQERLVFERRLVAEGLSQAVSAPKAPVVPLRPRWSGLYRFSLAAAALLATLVVGIRLGSLRDGTVDPETMTGATPLLYSLRAQGEAPRRSSGEEIDWPAEFDSLVLRLLLGDVTPHESYRAEITDQAGEIRHRQADLPQQPNGSFILTLPRGALAAGSYKVRLLARDGDDEQVLATFSFLLQPIPPEP
jgi:Putative zinc-finger